ncbi:TonB-dependent receptor [Sphingobacterium hungaricum]
MKIQLFFLTSILLVFSQVALAQTKITGTLIDSVYNRVLESTTVSVYEQGKKSVDKVTMTDRYGKFEILESFAGKPLILELSHQGYEVIRFDFQLSANEKKDFGKINMKQILNEIDVVDLIPPVRMNGDTIEFNADAFQLDSNAVIEDLLNKLPGMVVWGDGAVTYNGRTIPNVLVNGKQFFGSDMAIALQNIDKKAVDKLQIYDKRNHEEKEKDPEGKKLEMNVVLKEGKQNMLFGNIGAGYGTEDRHQTSLNVNKATKKAQITAAYSGSNINKDLANIDQLLKNTTFKGIGINADFTPDFLRQGILEQQIIGGRYQYDFNGEGKPNLQHTATGNVTARWNKNRNKDESNTILLNPESTDHNFRSYSSENEQEWRVQTANFTLNKFNYNYQQDKRTINYHGNVWMDNSKNDDSNSSLTTYDYLNNQSYNKLDNSDITYRKNLSYNGSIDVQAKPNYSIDGKSQLSFVENLSVNLQLNGNFNDAQFESFKMGDYVNLLDETLNKLSNRNYDQDESSRNFNSDLLVKHRLFGLRNRISFNNLQTYNLVSDLIENDFQKNNDLSHDSKFNQLEYEPSLEFYKTLKSKYLNGRYYYSFNLNAALGTRIFRYTNVSSLDYRNLEQKFNSFLPSLNFSYNYSKIGKYYTYHNIGYKYNEEYANLNQLRPIYDDIYPAYRYFGAVNPLKATGVHLINYRWSYNQQRQYASSIYATAEYRLYTNGLTDSLVYNENQQQNFTVQIPDGMHLLTFNLNYSKPFPIKKNHSLTLNVTANGNWGNKFQFVDGNRQEMINSRIGGNINAYYTILNKFQLGWKNDLNYYTRKDKLSTDNKNDYSSTAWNSGLAAAYQLTKRWTLNSSVDNRSNFSKFQDNNALIWNANMTYRLLKGNNLEIKMEALDLLRQNKGFYFYDGVTEFTTGNRNILTQYYMLTLSYMPRKFGK